MNGRLNATLAEPPMDGLERGGWKLIYRDKPGEQQKARDSENGTLDLSSSIGLLLKTDGRVIDVVPGKASDKGGIGPGMKVVAVNGRRFSPEVLRDAIKAAKNTSATVDLLVENTDYYKTYKLDYHGGEMYPHLTRDESKPDLLSEILKAR